MFTIQIGYIKKIIQGFSVNLKNKNGFLTFPQNTREVNVL